MGMKNRSSAGAATFDTFENPVTDGDDEPVLDGERSPSEGDRSPSVGDRSPSEGDRSPSVGDRSPSEGDRSPAGPDQLSVFEMESADFESEGKARQTSRNEGYHLILIVGTAVLLPAFLLFAAFMVWVTNVQTNALNVLSMCVSLIMPAVMYVGCRGATTRSEPVLRGYSFAVSMVITMQMSAVVVIAFDDGTLADAYVESCAVGFLSICSNLDDLPVGAGWLNTDKICKCTSTATDSFEPLRNSTGNGDEHSQSATLGCIRDLTERELTRLLGSQITGMHVVVGVIIIEALLAVLAYNMIVDLDQLEARKAQKRKGGAPTGYIRGTIVGGSDLRTAKMNVAEAKSQRKWRRKLTPQLSCLAAKLAMETPGLHKSRKHHSVQTVETHGVEDDCSPMWNQSFEKLVTYASSRRLEITVSDQHRNQKQIVGSTTIAMKGENLVDLDHCMDGNGVVIGLSWTDPSSLKEIPAGSVTLQLAFIPTPPVVTSKAGAVTSSWYFEVTVIGAVFLNMVVLALQSPASPPPVLLHGALRVIEIFCATHMLVEFILELAVHMASKTAWYRDEWLVLLLLLLVVSWLSIAAPVLELASVGDELTADASSNNISSTAVLDNALYEASGAKTAPAARLVAAFADQAVRGTTDSTEQLRRAVENMVRKLLSVFRVSRIFRPIRTLRLINNINIVILVITETARLLLTVVILMLFLLSIFTLIGLSSYTGALQYECMPHSQNREKPECDAGQMLSATLMQGGRREIGNDVHGLLDYDTFLRGFVATFVQTTGDGGMHSIPLALVDSGASLSGTAWLISFASSVFLNMLSLNLFLAVLCSSYGDIISSTEELKLAQERAREKYRTMMQTRGNSDLDFEEVDTVEEPAAKISIEDRIHDKNWFAEGSNLAGFRERLKMIATSLWFERATSVVIICNTFSMALVHENMSTSFRDNLRFCEIVFLCIFITEAAVKLVGLGSSIFFSSAENKLDVVIIAMSIVGFIGTFYTDEVEALFGLEQRSLASVQSLRGIRLIRALQIIRLLQRQKALAAVLRTISLSWKPLLAHSFFCVFSISGLAILGMHVFGGSLGPGASIVDYDIETPANLETFNRGFLTFFELFVGENWSHVMYWYTKYAAMGHGFSHFVVQLYFMASYIWLNSILFSLCIAMLLENFSVAEEDKEPIQKRLYEKRMREKARKRLKSVLESTVEESQRIGHAHSDGLSAFEMLEHASHGADLDAVENKSLFLFKLNNPFRLWAAEAQASPLFSNGVTCLILFSCVSLALEGPGEGSTGWAQEHLGPTLRFVDVAVLFCFVLEALLKCLVHGCVLVSGPTRPYLATTANRVDALIILLCTLSYVDVLPLNGAAARALRVGRVITPMVNLAKHPSIKLVFVSFARAGPDTAVVLLPLAILGLIFGTVGVATFGSAFKRCVTVAEPLVALHDNRTLCDHGTGVTWASPPFHFDDVPHAMATLFTALTDGAHGLMLDTADQGSVAAYAYWVPSGARF